MKASCFAKKIAIESGFNYGANKVIITMNSKVADQAARRSLISALAGHYCMCMVQFMK